eukprot:m.316254 g.316254  ORF g.316254 m.316254 type:complete len:55 (+) comp27541_c0_seq2:3607-3771(+)
MLSIRSDGCVHTAISMILSRHGNPIPSLLADAQVRDRTCVTTVLCRRGIVQVPT